MKTVYSNASTLSKGKTLVVKAALWLLRKAWNRKEMLSVSIRYDYASAFCLAEDDNYIINYSVRTAEHRYTESDLPISTCSGNCTGCDVTDCGKEAN